MVFPAFCRQPSLQYICVPSHSSWILGPGQLLLPGNKQCRFPPSLAFLSIPALQLSFQPAVTSFSNFVTAYAGNQGLGSPRSPFLAAWVLIQSPVPTYGLILFGPPAGGSSRLCCCPWDSHQQPAVQVSQLGEPSQRAWGSCG